PALPDSCQVGRHDFGIDVRSELASDQHIIEVRHASHSVRRRQQVAQLHTGVPLIESLVEDVALQTYGVLQLLDIREDSKRVAVLNGLTATVGTGHVDVLHGRTTVRHDALELDLRSIRVGDKSARERHQLHYGALTPKLVDG